MRGNNDVRYISAFILVVFVFIALGGVALASTSSAPPVKSTSPEPASSTPKSGVKAGAAPTLTSIEPNKARVGWNVTLKGVGFGSTQGSSYVSFGPFKATVYPVWSDTEILCAVPPITGVTFPVTGPVVVVTPDGTSNAVAFTALGPHPTVTSVFPPVGSPNSTMNITIIGTGFQRGAKAELYWVTQPYGYSHTIDVTDVVVASSTLLTGKITIPNQIPLPPATFIIPTYTARVDNPDGGIGTGGSFNVGLPCGLGAVSPVLGIGLMMGVLTLAGTIRGRRRRTKKS